MFIFLSLNPKPTVHCCRRQQPICIPNSHLAAAIKSSLISPILTKVNLNNPNPKSQTAQKSSTYLKLYYICTNQTKNSIKEKERSKMSDREGRRSEREAIKGVAEIEEMLETFQIAFLAS